MSDTAPQPFGEYVVSVIRTVVPVIAGLIVGKLADWGLSVDDGAVELVISGIAISGWYIVWRAVENWWTSKAGILLGIPKAPSYDLGAEDPDLEAAA